MANPGDIRVGLRVALTGGVSDPRNETIMKMFTLVEIGERAGSGIPDFANTWEKYMGALPQFKVTYNPARTCLSMPCFVGDNIINDGTDSVKSGTDDILNKSKHQVLGKRQCEILRLMKDSPKITQDKLVKGLNISRRTLSRDISFLISKGFLKREGGDFGGSWIVLDENSLR
jgi:predicted HTH transcriptional regulator